MDTVADCAREVGLVVKCRDSFDVNYSPTENIFAKSGWNAVIGTATLDNSGSGQILLSYYCKDNSKPGSASPQESAIEAGAFQWVCRNGCEIGQHDRLRLKANRTGHVGSSHGSSSGITLQSGRHWGRLLSPARFQTQPGEALDTLQNHHYNCALYSDDHGRTWQTSEPVQVGTGEGCLVELSDGKIYYNSRAYFLDGKRRIAWSYDDGETFTDFGIDDQLTEPVNGGCNAGMAKYPEALSDGKDIILFCNPVSDKRERLTVRASYDGGQTWPVSKTIHKGPAAYSSITISPDGTIYVLFENGRKSPYEKISLARFDMKWLIN
jgi:sialidase-1